MRSHVKEKLKGYDFFTINQFHQRALAIESRSRDSKEDHRHHRANVHDVDYDSESSNDDSNDVYAAEFVWLSKSK